MCHLIMRPFLSIVTSVVAVCWLTVLKGTLIGSEAAAQEHQPSANHNAESGPAFARTRRDVLITPKDVVVATVGQSRDMPRIELKSAAFHNDRGEEFRKKGEIDDAIKEFSQAIRVDPLFTWPYNNRGLAWAAKGDFDKALKDYGEAIRLDPKYVFPYNNRGLVWAAKGEFENAVKDYSEAIRLDPNYAFAFNNRGLVRESQKDFESALKDYSVAIQLDPKYANPLNHRGRLWEAQGDFSKAIGDYAEGIQVDPKYAAPYNSIAWLRATCHDARFRGGKEAIVYATKACELTDWKSYAELDTLAAAYAEAGEFTTAVIWQMTVVEKAPERERQAAAERLELYRANRPYHQSEKR